ncbi:FAD/NAD(P)-binding protein [Reichenbachiella agarivorans]|uniref:FAD/NAD(P)-binding protein n=1 Tax=Reichenbachiella agarivorans TaxID=2979464 RepID=A0ABY6CRA1_9BACT|nr:FAD/NAD(P)-binding protein [Reichenbachiella agarivorans]UXP33018.1 FAD/NAD(P)-binding protein [Reichenbachiella agarivorans]
MKFDSTDDTTWGSEHALAESPVYIAIIGGGPKGIYGFERLVAQCKKVQPTSQIVVHIFNRTRHFAAGEVYNPSQPDFLKMNIPSSQINMWLPDAEPSAVCQPLSFEQWSELNSDISEPIKSDTFPSRSLVGRYLINGYERIKMEMPANLTLREVVGEVVDMNRHANGYQLVIRDESGRVRTLHPTFQYILLTTGHPTPAPTTSRHLVSNAPKPNYISFIYPVEQKMDRVAPGSVVGIKGMGLTFVDCVLALTEGRGGRFSTAIDGKLIYEKSGLEPRLILPFCRNGLPMIPRTGDNNKLQLRFFTPSSMAELGSQNGKLDFESEIWPLVRQEYVRVHYMKLFELYNYPSIMETDQPYSYATIQQDIEWFHMLYPHIVRFDLNQFFDPLSDVEFQSDIEYHRFIVGYLEEGLDVTKQKSRHHFLSELTDVWNAAAGLFGDIYAHGGLTPQSQKKFENFYAPRLHRVSYGPPHTTMEKILTLAQQGLIHFSAVSQIHQTDHIGTRLVSKIDETAYDLDTMVNARIPKTHMSNVEEGVYHQLLSKGEICIYRNSDVDSEDSHMPGCLALDKKGFVIDANGKVNMSIAVMGTPTEGVTYNNDALTPSRNNFVSHWSDFVLNEIKNTECHVPNYC